MNNSDLHLFLHGLIILLLGLLGGIPFASAIKRKENEVAWRVVHAGSSMGGVMLIAIGGLISRLNVLVSFNLFLSWGIIIATYLFVIGMILAAIYNERGLERGKSGFKAKLIYSLYSVGAILSVISILGLIGSAFKSIYF
jgi:uncharacterized membrane protein (DUF485 family)